MGLYLLAYLLGALLTLAFAPFNLFFLSVASLGGLFYLWSLASRKQATLLGLYFGLGLFSTGTYWIYISIRVYGETAILPAALLSALLFFVLSLFIAAAGFTAHFIFSRRSPATKCLLAYPAIWVIWEWLRCHLLFNGFPWLMVGYTLEHSPFRSLANLVGLWGLSLIAAVLAGAAVMVVTQKSKKIYVSTALLFTALLTLSYYNHRIQYTTPSKRQLPVYLVQGNVNQSIKWSEQQLITTIHTYYNLSTQIHEPGLVIWPETAIPAYPQAIPNYLTFLANHMDQYDSTLLTGMLLRSSDGTQFHNGLMLLGKDSGQYQKQHLVPFGEYFPLKPISTFILKQLNLPFADFVAGNAHQPALSAQGISVAPFICYEIGYPQLVLSQTIGKQVIIVISDDAWFGQSIALDQQLQMTTMRALETGRYVLAVNNTGITAIISNQGYIIKQLPINKRSTLYGQVTATNGNTPLMNVGYMPVYAVIFIMLLIAWRKKPLPKSHYSLD